MHEAFTTTTKNYVSSSTHDLLPPFYYDLRPKTPETNKWSPSNDSDRESPLESWNSSSESPSSVNSFRQSPYSAIPKIPTRIMASRDNGSQRWLLKNNNQVVDVDATTTSWDLADKIVRLNIGDAATQGADDAPIRTPPKSELASATLAQFTETSPLDTHSLPSADSSPHTADHQITISHSRGSSTDTTLSSQESAMSAALAARVPPPLKTSPANEPKERPHSFSGGLSSADLRRLQQAGEGPLESDSQLQQQQQQHWPTSQYRENVAEQLSYPSLTPNNVPVSRPQYGQPQSNRDDGGEYQRNFIGSGHIPQGGVPTSPPYMQGRPNVPYRQPPRFPQQTLTPGAYAAPHHQSMSVGNTQQVYDMMLQGAGPENSAIPPRVQQQHNLFRGAHHHSTSDPSQIREAANLGLLNVQAFNPGLFPPNMPVSPPALPMFPAQFYGGQEAYRDPAIAQVMAGRLQAQYTGSYGVVNSQIETGMPSPGSSTAGSGGPSANNRKLGLYKTELCRSWEEKGTCRYGAKCQFAHGEQELRRVSRHPKYKTEICRTFWVSGSCPYGKRCCFIHTELPAPAGAGAPNAGDSPQQPSAAQPHTDTRARSMSTNSDPNEGGVSLLARLSGGIGTKRSQELNSNSSTPVDNKSGAFQQFSRPLPNLKLDTNNLDGATFKQNKSAYPTFANNGILLPNVDQMTAKSPAPVTAGPDLGRHNNARLEIVGYNQARMNKSGTPPANARHTASGSDDFSYNYSQGYSVGADDSNNSGSRANGHVRAGSAGNWGNFNPARNTHLTNSAYPHAAASPVGEVSSISSPWTTTELTMGSSRLNEKAWA